MHWAIKLEECKLDRTRRVYGAETKFLLNKGRRSLVTSKERKHLKRNTICKLGLEVQHVLCIANRL